ncbi:MAG: CoA transferase, partial [Actinomycetota bacterium]|nr:CoA transferase [Actinomycetota bacterium]
MLEHIRVIDLCDGVSQFAGHLLASLGAEVIAVERPGGSATRRLGPFVDDITDPNASLYHWAYNRGKQSAVIDIDTDEGRDTFRRLIVTADVLFEDSRPGQLASLGLGHHDLAALNPALVHASITPYGSEGPRVQWAGSDLTAVAGSGFQQSTGDADRAPVRIGLPQSFLQAAGDAAGAALIALRERKVSGLGQHIDVSAQESLTLGQPSNLAGRSNAALTNRMAGGTSLGGLNLPLLFPCKDGYTICVMLMGVAFAPFCERFVAWEMEEGFGNDELAAIDWVNFARQLQTGEIGLDVLERANEVHTRFLATKTKAELWAAAFERHLLVTPSQTVGDLLDYEHLIARGFWEDVTISPGRTARHPGPLARFTSGQPSALDRAPALGEHTEAVTFERRPDVPTAPGAVANRPALEGLKVVEFSWVIATPSAVRVLADYGATVIKVENGGRPDTMRTVNPFVDEDIHFDNSVGYGVYNAGKRSLSLDLSKPEARDVVLDLARWADVMTESFAPGAIGRMGYGYEELSAVNPGLIMLSSSLLGQTGPHSKLAGYGFMAAAIAGFYEMTGWADRDPAGPYGPYTDFLAPRIVLSAIMAALEHRDRTGNGQHIDLSQTESALHYLAPAILDQSINGRTFARCGNEDRHLTPHGVFASHGDDSWVAIACTDDRWPRLADIIGEPTLADLDNAARRDRAAEIEALITSWTRQRGNDQAAIELQANGIDAYPVHNSVGTSGDPQLEYRRHQIVVPQSYRGTMWTHNCR